MDSSVDTKQSDPNVSGPRLPVQESGPKLSTQEAELVARADERLAHAYEQIAHADEQLARINEQIYRLEHDAVRTKSVSEFRRPSRGGAALRGLLGLLLMAAICGAAFIWQSSGDARQMISRWVPQLAPASSSPSDTPQLAAQQNTPAVQLAAADSAVSPPAPTAPQEAAAAPIPPEVTQLLQTMARDLANVQEGIHQLKAGQEEMVRENARIAEQIKSNQEQMARVIATASEQNRPKPPAAPVTTSSIRAAPVAAAAPRPATPPSAQARAQARAPSRQQ